MDERKYRLYVKVDGRWVRECDITAVRDKEAFHTATTQIKPEHYDKPMKLTKIVKH